MKKNVQLLKSGDVILVPMKVMRAVSFAGGEGMKVEGIIEDNGSNYTTYAIPMRVFYTKDSKVQVVEK